MPVPSKTKKRTPIHSGDDFGLAFGGGCLTTRFERLFGIASDSSRRPDIFACA
jgi:hypothetical protein